MILPNGINFCSNYTERLANGTLEATLKLHESYLYYKGPIKTILDLPKKKSPAETCTNEIVPRITVSLKSMAPNHFSQAST